MGTNLSHYWNSTKISLGYEDYKYPETAPHTDRPPTFDPLYGFPNGRKPREMKASWDEMERFNLTYGERDYCAHKLIDVKRCMTASIPLGNFKCADLQHDYHQCEYEDFLLRMKEYEREKRLLKRMQRKQKLQEVQS